jgi:hypothetical protein
MRNHATAVCLLVALSTPASSFQSSGTVPPGRIELAKHQPQLEPPIGPQPQKLDPLKLRQQADELSSLAQSLPSDIAQVTQGKLPRDTGDKLKRIEKLSKQLRSELAP